MNENPTGDNVFDATFKRYYPLIYQIAYRCVGQQDEAEDIVQEVFLRFYRTPPHATDEAQQRAWLCRVATNIGLSALRAHRRRLNREERVAVLSTHTGILTEKTPEEYVLADERATLVREVLADLPERQQTYLLLRASGLSYAEIARATGVAVSSVGTLLARAERDFRRRYDERTHAASAE